MPNTIIITPDRNTANNDYKGAFEPESIHYQRVVPGKHTLIKIDISKGLPTRQAQLFAALDALKSGDYRAVAVFCHGWENGIQAGPKISTLPEFVRLLCAATTNGVEARDVLHVALYCCSTALGKDTKGGATETGGDGGFADTMRDEFCRQKRPWVRVFAHTNRGHTTTNPYVRVFEGQGSTIGLTGAQWLVPPPPPKNELWPRWRDALASKAPFDAGTMKAPAAFSVGMRGPGKEVDRKFLRLAAPFMTIAELHAELLPEGVV